MKKFEYVIKDELGIHARPAGLLIKEAGIDVTNLVSDESVPTTMAFVHTLPGGDTEGIAITIFPHNSTVPVRKPCLT